MPGGTQDITRVAGAGPKVEIIGSGYVAPLQIESNVYSDREGGTVGLIAAAPGDDTTGYVGFYRTGSLTRTGFIGASSVANGELNVQSDHGSVNLVSPGSRLYVQTDGQIVFTDGNGVRKARIDMGTGNMVIAGALTQNGAP